MSLLAQDCSTLNVGWNGSARPNEAHCIVAFEFGIGQRWLNFPRLQMRWLGVFNMAMDRIDDATQEFMWRHGRDLITLTRAGESWQVSYLTSGRLLGPRQCVYQASHRTAKFAAWDVMARVINASRDEDEGLQVALRAAQWMRRSESSHEENRA